VARHHLHLVAGARVDVDDFTGREAIVVLHPLAGGC
jgi:hypothetical protein